MNDIQKLAQAKGLKQLLLSRQYDEKAVIESVKRFLKELNTGCEDVDDSASLLCILTTIIMNLEIKNRV